jgi:hypothetical protein
MGRRYITHAPIRNVYKLYENLSVKNCLEGTRLRWVEDMKTEIERKEL